MANSVLLKRIANEVETLISQNPKAVERFREQLKVFNDAWQKYWSAKDNELPPLTERPDKSKKDAYEYDRHFKCWLPKESPTFPPDPTKWELDDRYSCYYGTLAVIYDSEKSKVAPFRLCEGILDNLVFAWMQMLLSRAWGFDKDMLDTALKWVKSDIRQQQEKDGQSKTNIPDYKALNLAKVPISRLIEQGESYTLEFKETLDYDTQNKGKNKDILLSSLKTIAGFLNAAGGTLLIGIDDSGKIKGIMRDLSIMKNGNNDKVELKIRNCLKDRLQPQPIGEVNISFENFRAETICRVDVQTSKDIIHLDNKVYVREGNTTQLLDGRTLTEWIQKRKRTR